MIKTNADAKANEDASPISYRRRRSRPTPKRPSARSRRPGNTAVAPLDSHASNTPYSIQSHTMPTHAIQSIHIGPCLDQHPACGLLATPGSEMERGGLALWEGEGGDLGGGERGDGGCRGGIDEESDWGSHGLRMVDLRNCQGSGAAHSNSLQCLAITRSRKVLKLKLISTHTIRCSCY